MCKPIMMILLLVVLMATAQATLSSAELIEPIVKMPPPMPRPILGPSNAVEHFILGHKVAGALPVYTHQNAITYDSTQSEITVHVDYPVKAINGDGDDNDDDNDANTDDDNTSSIVITQVDIYMEGNEGFQTQAYLIEGGIGQSSISIEIVANDTDLLRYTVIVYAQKV